jgi:hypothetical protein
MVRKRKVDHCWAEACMRELAGLGALVKGVLQQFTDIEQAS